MWSKKLFTSSLRVTKDQFNFSAFEFSKQHANIITQQRFLEKCKVSKIIPKSFRFKYYLNTYNETNHTRKVNLLNLNHLFKDKGFQR